MVFIQKALQPRSNSNRMHVRLGASPRHCAPSRSLYLIEETHLFLHIPLKPDLPLTEKEQLTHRKDVFSYFCLVRIQYFNCS